MSSAVALRVRDYYPKGKRWYVDLAEKGGKSTTKLAHHRTQDALDAYLTALAAAPDDQLFQSMDHSGQATGRALSRRNALHMVKRRAAAAGLDPSRVSNHSFRATGITNYMGNGGHIDVAQEWVSCNSSHSLSDRQGATDKVSLEEVERIRFERQGS